MDIDYSDMVEPAWAAFSTVAGVWLGSPWGVAVIALALLGFLVSLKPSRRR